MNRACGTRQILDTTASATECRHQAFNIPPESFDREPLGLTHTKHIGAPQLLIDIAEQLS
jgi:hypothetical protein